MNRFPKPYIDADQFIIFSPMDFIPPYIFFARDYQYLTKSGLLELQLKQTLFLDHTAHRSTGSSKALLEELEHPKLKVEC